MTPRQRTDIIIVMLTFIVAGAFGYFEGKHAADRYYAEHPVTLIQPLKYRVPAT